MSRKYNKEDEVLMIARGVIRCEQDPPKPVPAEEGICVRHAKLKR
jgi:hypothetical protein